MNEDTTKGLLAGLIIGMLLGSCLVVIIAAGEKHGCQAWAADAEKAEYYLDPKTGKTEWRWKQQTLTTYGGSLYLNTQ